MPNKLKKTCGRCNLEKNLDDYFHNSTKKDHHNGICKSCQIDVNKENEKKKKEST